MGKEVTPTPPSRTHCRAATAQPLISCGFKQPRYFDFLPMAARRPKSGITKRSLPKSGARLADKLASQMGGKRNAQPNTQSKPRGANGAAVAGSGMLGGHTIVLVQDTPNKSSRTWNEHESLSAALDAFTSLYEQQLRKLNPQAKQLSYTVHDLHTYVDSVHDLSVMVYDKNTRHYAPRGKPFIKAQLLARLKAAAVK